VRCKLHATTNSRQCGVDFTLQSGAWGVRGPKISEVHAVFSCSQQYLTIHTYLSRYSLHSARTVGAKVQARAVLCEYSRAKTQEMMYPASTDSLKLYSGSTALCGHSTVVVDHDYRVHVQAVRTNINFSAQRGLRGIQSLLRGSWRQTPVW